MKGCETLRKRILPRHRKFEKRINRFPKRKGEHFQCRGFSPRKFGVVSGEIDLPCVMNEFLMPNPEVRVVPEVPDEFAQQSGTVGFDWADLIHRGKDIDTKRCLVVSTPAQMDQAMKIVESEVVGNGLVVVDAKRDYADTSFGVVTLGLLGGDTVIIPLHVLAANAGVPLERLGPHRACPSRSLDGQQDRLRRRPRGDSVARVPGRHWGSVRSYSGSAGRRQIGPTCHRRGTGPVNR